MDSELLLKFIGYFPDHLSALSRALLRFFWPTFVETAVWPLQCFGNERRTPYNPYNPNPNHTYKTKLKVPFSVTLLFHNPIICAVDTLQQPITNLRCEKR